MSICYASSTSMQRCYENEESLKFVRTSVEARDERTHLNLVAEQHAEIQNNKRLALPTLLCQGDFR
eukprot:scaffold22301_cov133-Skeletonema_dohrnii-CCMP3373.AAC.2